ncbi:hypothetical protein RHGRI_031504 [Rhododendron griersonianum]|uniref:S-protein homolog n=1 Tax=Rhododendron griersonianum TaxID=479676 RepID=A0AAV6IBL2_9ERIC|nr:hypothetical protein RHGRI_031504 [Rhododendron griersonianum]
MTFRCQSKDDDMGTRTTKYREDFHWRFVPNVWGKTLYFCHFYWGSKQRVFVWPVILRSSILRMWFDGGLAFFS